MYYYDVGKKLVNGEVWTIIDKSEVEIAGRTPMNEQEAVALLTHYENENRIVELKKMLHDTDYIDNKIVEQAATIEEYADLIAQRQAWRDEINELETE